MTTVAPTAMLGLGEVRHARLRPIENRFAYPTCFLMLPMRALRARPSPTLARNRRFSLIGFHDADHGDGGGDSLAWLERMLAGEGVRDATGEIWLQCFPRVLGFAFKPVSFWYCHRGDGELAAIVVEVNNTFGERHCYLLHGGSLGFGRELRAAKSFHVSPFCRVAGEYRFRFQRTPGDAAGSPARIVARIDLHDESGALLETSVSGALRPLTRGRQARAFLGFPLMAFGVVARIHWQALRLWAKRVPFRRKPAPPAAFVTHSEVLPP